MSLITVVEYAKQIGRHPATVRQKVLRGMLSAQKVGRDWLIDEDEPYIDNRIKSGKYTKKKD